MVEEEPVIQMRGRSIVHVLFVIALITMALIGVLYLGQQLIGAPFAPTALYDWLVRGGVYRLTGLATAAVGDSPASGLSAGEWLVSMLLLFIPALLAGLLLQWSATRRGSGPDAAAGLVAGAALGLPLILISLLSGRSALHPIFQILWLALCFIAWGLSLSYALRRLSQLPDAQAVADDEADAIAPVGGMDRRRFLLSLGASTAAVTALSAAAGAALGEAGARFRLPRDFPIAGPEFRDAQGDLLGGFRRFAIIRLARPDAVDAQVVALGAEYPDQHYVSVWLGEGSPIVIYESLETALAAYDTDGESEIVWLDH